MEGYDPLNKYDGKALVAEIIGQAADALQRFDTSISVEDDAKAYLADHIMIGQMKLDEVERAQIFGNAILIFASAAVWRPSYNLYSKNVRTSQFRVVDAPAIAGLKQLPWPFNEISSDHDIATAEPDPSLPATEPLSPVEPEGDARTADDD